MANKKRGRKFNLRPVRFESNNPLTTVGDNLVVTAGLTGTSANGYRCKSVKSVWSLKGLTVGQGPIMVGYAHSDYSTTEIKEAIEASGAIDIGNKVAQEQANRLVRIVGQFSGDAADETLNDGKPLKTKLNWAVGIGDEVSQFAYNDSGAPLTTGAEAGATGTMWIQDRL